MPIVKATSHIMLRTGANAARWLVAGLLTLCLHWSVLAAEPQYRLAAGDIMEISIARIPELQRRVSIDMAGSISFPLIGTVVVAGLAPTQAQAKIQSLLAGKIFQMRSPNGEANVVVINPEEVTATVAEYRPVYVNGDVSKPGSYPFRLPMTVRQAVALAGGYDTMGLRSGDPALALADLKSEYETLWIEFAKERAHAWRVKAELGEGRDPEQKILAGVPLPESEASGIVGRETALINADQAEQRQSRDFIEQSIKQGSDQMATLSEQHKAQEQGANSDVEQLQKDLDLLNRGLVSSQRVTDSRRAVLLSSTGKLQTLVQLMQLEKQQSELQWRLQELDDHRRIELLRELQDAGAKLAEIAAKLRGTEDKIQYIGSLRSRLTGELMSPEIAIIRDNDNGPRRVAATEDSPLQPGDVVEVALRRGGGAAGTQ